MTQSTFCHVDKVLIIFGMLQALYWQVTDPDKLPAVCKILNSIDKRWGNSEQKLFVAGAILNPHIKLVPFRQSGPSMFSYAGLCILFDGLYWWFFNRAPSPMDLIREIREYIKGTGKNADLFSSQERILWEVAIQAVSAFSPTYSKGVSPNPRRFYYDVSTAGSLSNVASIAGEAEFQKLPILTQLAWHIY